MRPDAIGPGRYPGEYLADAAVSDLPMSGHLQDLASSKHPTAQRGSVEGTALVLPWHASPLLEKSSRQGGPLVCDFIRNRCRLLLTRLLLSRRGSGPEDHPDDRREESRVPREHTVQGSRPARRLVENRQPDP